jgi:hypothetical protein
MAKRPGNDRHWMIAADKSSGQSGNDGWTRFDKAKHSGRD